MFWMMIEGIFGYKLNKSGKPEDLFKSAIRKKFGRRIQNIWIAFVISAFWVIWIFGNRTIIEGARIPLTSYVSTIIAFAREADHVDAGSMRNKIEELLILCNLNIQGKMQKAPRIMTVQ